MGLWSNGEGARFRPERFCGFESHQSHYELTEPVTIDVTVKPGMHSRCSVFLIRIRTH